MVSLHPVDDTYKAAFIQVITPYRMYKKALHEPTVTHTYVNLLRFQQIYVHLQCVWLKSTMEIIYGKNTGL